MNRWWLSYGLAVIFLVWLCQDWLGAAWHDPQNRWLGVAGLLWLGVWLRVAGPAVVSQAWQPRLVWLGSGLALGTMGWMGALNLLQHAGLSLVLVSAVPGDRPRWGLALCAWVAWPAAGWGLARLGWAEGVRLLPLLPLTLLFWTPKAN